MTHEEALRIILNDPKTNGYAKTYAQAAFGMDGNARKVQYLYILNNLQQWRGDTARLVKAYMRGYIAEYAKGQHAQDETRAPR